MQTPALPLISYMVEQVFHLFTFVPSSVKLSSSNAYFTWWLREKGIVCGKALSIVAGTY